MVTPLISNQTRKQKDTNRIEDEQVEILLETPEDVKQLTGIAKSQKCHRIRLADKLFGPPQWTLRWNQRRSLFQQLGNLENLTTLVVHGTIMGQVIPGQSLALSINAPNLRILKVEGGIILDSITYVEDMAEAVRNHKSLQEFSFLNFLNHITPVDSLYLLDPLLGALCTIPIMTNLQLRCFSSFMHWNTSFASSPALRQLLQSTKCLNRLELTNLGLEDDQMQVIASNTQPKLQELILNANGNTKTGLNSVLDGIRSHWTKLEVANDVKFNKDSFNILNDHLRSYSNCLQFFACTFPLGMEERKRAIDLQLELHRMNLNARYYSPLVSPEQRIQLLGEVTAAPNQLDFVYTLLREEPMICDLEMNGLGVRLLKDTRMQQLTLLLLLWLIWSHYLLGLPPNPIYEVTKRIEIDLLCTADRSSSLSIVPDIAPTTVTAGMSRLDLARSKRNVMRSRVQMKIDALARTTPSKRSMEEKSNGNSRIVKHCRLEMQSQRNSLRNAMASFCNGI
ncbi:unnamed protein product [Cylindrotheca closterium]|uniref:Uncharacterized protein n=1 Tax=Cylindrotheca closterium TaxID=2856 RepID=A0AAD2FWE9_9STRA|nr:unnamed protein product [Cylindrotheca closterium]